MSSVHHVQLLNRRFLQIMSLSFIANHHNLAITGPCGVGKTFLACCVGTQGARLNYKVKYLRCSSLIEQISTSRLDGTYRSFVSKLFKTDLLIIDDWGLSPITVNGSKELLEIIDDRCDAKSTIISSQLPIELWHSAIEDKTAADAIIDRFANLAIEVCLTGESMRRKKRVGMKGKED
ncbi:ATP-binding protein [Ferrimicrobium acidiphilum]|uniref:ATP-binding protein n=1 Tax=Ferrimicrobium acidiphilum TaxID=121039 RepID=UPI0023F3CA41|nr:ATP-binding protein [Ferrimicrobium acidiphilum]